MSDTNTNTDQLPPPPTPPDPPVHPFKSTSWCTRTLAGGQRKRTWKSLKQIVSGERAVPGAHPVHYATINAPPSFRPAEKFSDLSGLPAPYTCPQTRLRYSNKEEYATLIRLPMDITAGYLAIRGATSIVG